MKATKWALLAIALLLGLGSAGCGNQATTTATTTALQTTTTQTPPPTMAGTAPIDYSQAANWLELPTATPQPVDVFYVYPTVYSKDATTDPDVCAIDNPQMMQGAKQDYQKQATAFAPSANIYAPYYRQFDAVYQLSQPYAQRDANIAMQPGPDVVAAFEYYLQHYNNGRPFILSAHSQGSATVMYLLSDYMKTHPDVYKRMIAAYIPGQSVTPQYLVQNPHLAFATGPSDTGVIISWNTEAETLASPSPITEPGGIAINPITWTTEEATATATQNLGSIQLDPTTGLPVLDQSGNPKRVMGLADARVDKKRGVVVCSSVNPADYQSQGKTTGVYHIFDYGFYYFDMRANAADRIEHFFAAK